MNPRIEELAKQVWPDPDINHTNHIKFARLIIEECLLALEPDWYGTEIEYEFEQRFYSRCNGIIKKHFGLDDEGTN